MNETRDSARNPGSSPLVKCNADRSNRELQSVVPFGRAFFVVLVPRSFILLRLYYLSEIRDSLLNALSFDALERTTRTSFA